MNKSTTFLLIFFTTLGLLSMVSFYGMIWYINSLNSDSVTLEQTYTNSQIKLKNVQSTSRTVRSAGDSLDKLENYMVKPGEELPIVQSIEQLAARSSLTEKTDVLGIDQSPLLASQNKEFLHVALSTSGSFERTMNFLSILETLPYNVKMNKVSLSAGASASSSATVWSASFDLSLVKEKIIHKYMDLNFDSIKQKYKQMYLLGRYPDRDWHRVFTASIALLACVGIWAFLFFIGIQSAGLSAINNLYAGVNHAIATPSDQLNDLIKSYDAKAAEHQALIDQLK